MNVYLIFLGSLLTFLATVTVESVKSFIARREKRATFVLLATQQLNALDKGFEKLKTALDYKNHFDFLILGSLEKGATNLESYKSDSIYLHSESTKEQFMDLISDISMYLPDVRSLQNVYYSEQEKVKTGDTSASFADKAALDKWFSEQRMQKIVDPIELKRRMRDFIREMK